MIEQTTLVPGQLIHDRYRIDVALASGGQADVYLAHHIELEREVAIKVLKTHGSVEVLDRMAKRFEQEAKLISKLRDPHTITLYDFGRLEDGALFMVFEYIDGISLKQLVTQQGGVEAYRVAKILKQTLSSLHEAHSMGVLHRDLKPANIMIYAHAGRQDLVKLLDFGIAKILRDDTVVPSDPNLTGDRIIGTPRYIAPELLLKEAPCASSDLYSLGMVGYELLVGKPAIKERAPLQIVARQIDPRSFTLPASLDVPQALREVIDRLLLKDPALRYQDALSASLDLKRWMHSSVPPQLNMESEAFEDFTPPDEVAAMRAYSERSKKKTGLNVVVPDALKSTPDLTPRTAFSQSIVFQGRPSVGEVNQLITQSLQGVSGTQHIAALSGESHTRPAVQLAAHSPHVEASGQLAPSLGVARSQSSFHATSVVPATASGRGGDTIAMREPLGASAHSGAKRGPDHQKVALLVIVILLVVILLLAVMFALLVMS